MPWEKKAGERLRAEWKRLWHTFHSLVPNFRAVPSPAGENGESILMDLGRVEPLALAEAKPAIRRKMI